MTQFNQTKYSVAWYKLSEFVVKKEKERALGILRLLVHSLNDSAFAAQLEGDLLYSFNDPKFVDSYLKAAQLYEKGQRIIEAVAMYEHLLVISPASLEYIQKLLLLYQILKNDNKILACWCMLLDNLLKKNMTKEVDDLCLQAGSMFSDPAIIHSYVVLALIRHGQCNQDILKYHLKMAIEYFCYSEDKKASQFLARLAALAPDIYEQSQSIIKEMDCKI